ncbi:MAG: hypothetical protein QM535_00365 [Limnohabitans sp.]|nr:hypothetical protein [Limnohabitans sp.]
MKFKKIVTILAILPFSLFGQFRPFSKVEIKSPQSYAFDKYGNVPVKLYTGAIDLQIPITSIPINDDKKIDVQLSYDSSGFIPHKKSDLAGVNWSLMAGGSITRVMNYIPDEYISAQIMGPSSPFQPGEYDFHGFYAGVKRNSYTNENAYNLSSGGVGHSEGDHWFIGPRNDYYEGEPDLFRFSIMGLSGEFMIGFDGKPKVKSNDPNLKVDLSGFTAHASKGCDIPYSEIILIDGEGTKYYFGGDLSKSEISFSQKKNNS